MYLPETEDWLTKVFYDGFYYGLVNYGSGVEDIEDDQLREIAQKALEIAHSLSKLETAIEHRALELDLDTEF